MSDFLNHWSYEFVTLLVILDPIATVPLFLAASGGLTKKHSTQLALFAVSIAFGILLFFIIFGQYLLDGLKIPMASFQLAGAIILLILGLQMSVGNLATHTTDMASEQNLISRATFPLALPGIAGAGGILTVILLTDNHSRTFQEQINTVGVLIACLSVHLIAFLSSKYILKWLGLSGIQIISRVFGLILTSVAVNNILIAIKQSFYI